jgi:hypothetical protein
VPRGQHPAPAEITLEERNTISDLGEQIDTALRVGAIERVSDPVGLCDQVRRNPVAMGELDRRAAREERQAHPAPELGLIFEPADSSLRGDAVRSRDTVERRALEDPARESEAEIGGEGGGATDRHT